MFSINFQGNHVGLHVGPTVALVGLFVLLSCGLAFGQSTIFTYQGRLQDTGTNANGSYDLQFTLWDAVSGGTQQPQPPVTVTRTAVQVVNGVFTTSLDFGANAFPGAGRWLETSVRTAGSGPFTILSPRQQITGTPYAIRSVSATTADTATNATQLGGVVANNYVQTNDSRLTDPRAPTPGSANYIQNTTSQQASANFNITGSGMVGGTLSANSVGIGTNAPNTPLDLAGAFSVRGSIAPPVALPGQGRLYFDSTLNKFRVSQNGGGFLDLIGAGGGVTGSGTTGAVPLWSNSTALGNSVITQQGGKVGIGTANPTDILTVNGDSTIGKAQSSGSTTYAVAYDEGSGFVGFQKRGTTQPGLTSMGLGNNASEILSTSGNLGLFTYNSGYLALGTNATERLRIDAGGNVGIGTTAPGTRLEIAGDAVALDLLRLRNTNTSSPRSFRIGPGVGGASIFGIRDDNATATRLAIDYNGNIGIGTSSPAFRLDVNGEIHAGMLRIDTYVSGNQQVCVETSTNRLGVCSPIPRSQTEVIPFASGLDIFESVKYNRLFKEQQNQIQLQQRLIAQQQQEIKQQRAEAGAQRLEFDALKKLVCLSNRRASLCR